VWINKLGNASQGDEHIRQAREWLQVWVLKRKLKEPKKLTIGRPVPANSETDSTIDGFVDASKVFARVVGFEQTAVSDLVYWCMVEDLQERMSRGIP